MSSTHIQIAIKVRPLIEREKREKLEPLWMVKENSIVQIDGTQNFISEPYSFDHIFDDTTSNKDVYDAVVKPLVMSFLEGINATIFAYGQTSSGKTHTMLGDKNVPGIINFTVDDIFAYIEHNTEKNFLIRCSYLEIYNEKINDLFDTNAKDVKIREDYNQGVYVTVKEEVIREKAELFILMKKGMKTRKIGCTDLNERSSRSHTIFRLVIQSQNKDSEGSYTESTLSLVDLAGSERVGQMNMGRERQAEGVSINKSLTTLGLVIRKLSENEPYINYRDSKLTRLLQYSLGGNSKTLIIATITVAAAEETKSTLEFAQRAKYVKNRPIINERVTDKDQLKQYENLCGEFKDQIEKLRLEKLERDKIINALEDKISNIKLFTAGNFERLGKLSRIPQRRHTLGHYKPHKKQFLVMDSGLEENSDNEDHVKLLSPVKSEVCFRVTNNVDDKENSLFEESMSPSKFSVFGDPSTPKTPCSKLRLEKELLEESYEQLRSFTNLEKEVQGKTDILDELRDLVERLREENFQLKEEYLKLFDFFTNVRGDNRDVYDKLIILRTILDVKPFEEVRRLQPIVEEDIDLFSGNLDSSECSPELSHSQNEENDLTCRADENVAAIIEENQMLKRQINDNERKINELTNDISNEKLNTELVLAQMNEENRQLKSQIDIKEAAIEKLKNNIIQDRDIKEAELEILNNKIKQLNDYKEEMHRKLSELSRVQDSEEDIASLKLQNAALKEDLQILKEEYSGLQQFAESDRRLIEQLREEIETLTKSESDKEKFILQKQSQIDTLNKDNEMLLNQLNDQLNQQNKYGILKEKNEQLKAEVDDLKFSLNGEQKELAKLNQELEKKSKDIESMEKIMCNLKNTRDEVENLTDINLHLRLEIEKMEEQVARMQEDNVKLKDKLELNSNIKQQFDENVVQMEGLKQIISEQKAEISDLKNKLHTNLAELDEKNSCYSDVLSKYNLKMREFEDLTKKNSELMQSILDNKCLDEENKKLKIELQDAVFQLGGEQKELENLCLQLDDKTRKIDALKKIVSDFKLSRESQMQEIQKLGDINSTLRNDLLQKAEHINTLQKIVDGECSREKCESSRQELGQIKEQFTCISDKLGELTELYNSSKAHDSEKNNLIKTLKEQIEKLENEQSEFSSESEIDNLRQLLEERTGEVNCLKEERKMLMQRIDTLSRDIEVLQFESEKNKSDTDDLRSQLVLERAELEKKTQMYNELSLNFCTKNEENREYVKQIAKLEEERTHMMTQVEKASSLEETVNRYLEDIHKFEAICEVQTNEISQLKSQLHLKIIELDETTDAYNALLHDHKLKMNENNNLKSDKEHLTACINSHVSLEGKIATYVKDIQDLQDICEDQKTKIDKLENRLDLKSKELDERTDSYNKLLSDYTIKKDEYNHVANEIKNIKIQLMQTLEKNASLEQTVSSYLNDIQILQRTLEIQKIEINELKHQLQSKTVELKDKLESYEHLLTNSDAEIINLKKEKGELIQRLDNSSTLEQTVRNYLSDIKLLQATSLAQKSEIKELKDKLLKLHEANESSDDPNREGIKLLTNSSFTDEVKTKIQNVSKLQEDIRSKSEEMERVSEDRSKLKVLVRELETSLSDTKRQLKERCEDYFHLKSKNSALEIELFSCKKNLAIKDQELQNEKMRMANLTAMLQKNTEHDWKHFSPVEQIAEHISRTNRLKRELQDAQQEVRCQTLQMKALQEEIEKSKRLILDTEKIRSEHEKCIHIFKTVEKELNEAESKHLLEKYDIREKSNKAGNKTIVLGEQLIDRLKGFERCYSVLNQELQNEKMKMANLTAILQNNTEPEWKHLSPEEQIAEHISKAKRLKRELEDAQQEVRSKTLQMKTLQGEIEKSKGLILDAEKIRSEHEKCIHIFKSFEKELNEAESKHLLERYDIQEKSNKAGNKIVALGEQLIDRLKSFERCYAVLKSQYDAQKIKLESLHGKLLDAETQVATLQAKVYESVTCKKRSQEIQLDKNPVSRISDENRPLSPNEQRKIKRRSIHDQRRGLAPDSGEIFEDDDLDIYQGAQRKLEIALQRNHQLEEDMKDVRERLELLASENEIMKRKENIGKDLVDCKNCTELRIKLCKCQEENKTLLEDIDNLKKENTFLDKENEDMLQIIKELEKRESDLYEELEKYKNSSSSDTDTEKIQIKLNDVIKKNTELQDEITRSQKVVEKYKHKIAKLEHKLLEEEHRRTRTDSLRLCSKEDKGTQATCDLHQANINLKKILRARRTEGNYLRAKLNLPPDCPVLPEDLGSESLKDCAPR